MVNLEAQLNTFIIKNKQEYLDLMQKYTDLFNKLGVETSSEALQLAFTGTIIYHFLNSISCDKAQKRQLWANIGKKL